MKKIVLTFGVISGLVGAVLMFLMAMVMNSDVANFDEAEIIGYSSMLLALLFVYIGMYTYKKNIGNGYISFGTSIKIGLLITLIYTVLYVISWMIIYYNFIPDFWDKYSYYMIESARKSGATEVELQEKAATMAKYGENYKNPVYVVLYTLMEPIGPGIIVTLVSALLVRIKNKPKNVVAS